MAPPNNSSNDVNSFLPLLFAAEPNLRPNYKLMSAMDPQQRTESSFEHKFRAWRQQGKQIAENYTGDGTPVKASVRKSSTPAGKSSIHAESSKAKSKASQDDEKDDESDADAKEIEENSTPKAKIPAVPAKGNNKRVASNSTPLSPSTSTVGTKTPSSFSGSPSKKPHVIVKKGTAQKVKKPAKKARVEAVTESSSEDDEYEGEEDAVEKGPIGKGARSKIAAAARGKAMGTDKGKKGVKEKDNEDDEDEGKVEMGFDK